MSTFQLISFPDWSLEELEKKIFSAHPWGSVWHNFETEKFAQLLLFLLLSLRKQELTFREIKREGYEDWELNELLRCLGKEYVVVHNGVVTPTHQFYSEMLKYYPWLLSLLQQQP
jgi:hypothetical protein